MKTDWLTLDEALDALHGGHKIRHANMTKIEYLQYADKEYICMPITGDPVSLGAVALTKVLEHYPTPEWLVLDKPIIHHNRTRSQGLAV